MLTSLLLSGLRLRVSKQSTKSAAIGMPLPTCCECIGRDCSESLLKVPPELGRPDLPRLARRLKDRKSKSEEYRCRQSGFCRYRFIRAFDVRAVWNGGSRQSGDGS